MKAWIRHSSLISVLIFGMAGGFLGCKTLGSLNKKSHGLEPATLKAMVGDTYWLGLSQKKVNDTEVYYFEMCQRREQQIVPASCLNVFRTSENKGIYLSMKTAKQMKADFSSQNQKSMQEIELSITQLKKAMFAQKKEIEAELAKEIRASLDNVEELNLSSEVSEQRMELMKNKDFWQKITGMKATALMLVPLPIISMISKRLLGAFNVPVLLAGFTVTWLGLKTHYFMINRDIMILEDQIKDEVVREVVADKNRYQEYKQGRKYLEVIEGFSEALATEENKIRQKFQEEPWAEPQEKYSLLMSYYPELISSVDGPISFDGTLLSMVRELAFYIHKSNGEDQNDALALRRYCLPVAVLLAEGKKEVVCYNI